MPRNNGIYSPPSGTTAVSQTPISSAAYNNFVTDITADQNNPRPIIAGGTGAATAGGARAAIGANDAGNLTAGTLPNARLSGKYDGITLKLTNGNTVISETNAGSPNALARSVVSLAEWRRSGSSTGAIVFAAPVGVTPPSMLHMEIDIFPYTSDLSGKIITHAYKAAGGAWTNLAKVSLGSLDIMVRWGDTPGGEPCLILGDVNTTWTTTHIAVARAMFSHTNVSDDFCVGWTCAQVTDLTGYTNVTSPVPNTLPATIEQSQQNMVRTDAQTLSAPQKAQVHTNLDTAALPGMAQAWVNFNGTNTVAINASHNVSSITDNGTGDYTINFAVSLGSATYAVVMSAVVTMTGGGWNDLNTGLHASSAGAVTLKSTTAVRVKSGNTTNQGSIDPVNFSLVIFGD